MTNWDRIMHYWDKIPYFSVASFLQLVMKWRTDHEEIAFEKLCDPKFTSSARLRNLLWFWSASLTMLLLWVVDFLQAQPCNRQPRLGSRFVLRGMNSHVTLAAWANSQTQQPAWPKHPPEIALDPILSAGQVRFPKEMLKNKRLGTHHAHNPQSPSIIILHTNRAFRWTQNQSIGSTRGVWSVSGEGKRTSQPNRGEL